MEGDVDGISWLPDLSFRVGKYGRVLFSYDGDDYYTHFLQPSAADMSSTPERPLTHSSGRALTHESTICTPPMPGRPGDSSASGLSAGFVSLRPVS